LSRWTLRDERRIDGSNAHEQGDPPWEGRESVIIRRST